MWHSLDAYVASKIKSPCGSSSVAFSLSAPLPPESEEESSSLLSLFSDFDEARNIISLISDMTSGENRFLKCVRLLGSKGLRVLY